MDSTKEATTEGKMITMNITIENTTLTATLENNDTAKAFVSQLPLTVDMSELNGNNTLVLFYKTFNTSYSYVKLGHINHTTGLA